MNIDNECNLRAFCVLHASDENTVIIAYPLPKWPVSSIPFGDKNCEIPFLMVISVKTYPGYVVHSL